MRQKLKAIIRIVALLSIILFFVGVIYKLSAPGHPNSLMALALIMNLALALFCIYDVINTRKPNAFAWISGFILLPGIAPFLYAFTGYGTKERIAYEKLS